jgi:hypothetical protein
VHELKGKDISHAVPCQWIYLSLHPSASRVRSGSARFTKLCGIFALLSHLLACAWYLVASTNAVDNWVTTSGLAAAPMAQKYLLAFYYQARGSDARQYWPPNNVEYSQIIAHVYQQRYFTMFP